MNEQTEKTIAAFIQGAIADPVQKAAALQAIASPRARKDKMLKTREAAKLAGIHPRTLREWESKGWLHPKHITPRRVRWSRSEIENFICEKAEG